MKLAVRMFERADGLRRVEIYQRDDELLSFGEPYNSRFGEPYNSRPNVS